MRRWTESCRQSDRRFGSPEWGPSGQPHGHDAEPGRLDHGVEAPRPGPSHRAPSTSGSAERASVVRVRGSSEQERRREREERGRPDRTAREESERHPEDPYASIQQGAGGLLPRLERRTPQRGAGEEGGEHRDDDLAVRATRRARPRRALAIEKATPCAAASAKTVPQTAASVPAWPGSSKSMPRRTHSPAPAAARSPEITTAQPDRFDHSVARSMRARMRSRSRLALPGSSNFVTQSTLLRPASVVKRKRGFTMRHGETRRPQRRTGRESPPSPGDTAQTVSVAPWSLCSVVRSDRSPRAYFSGGARGASGFLSARISEAADFSSVPAFSRSAAAASFSWSSWWIWARST